MTSNKQYLLILFTSVILASCSSGEKRFRIHSGEITVEFDKNSNCNIQWSQAGSNSLILPDTTIRPGIVADGELCVNFSRHITFRSDTKKVDSDFGPSVEAIMTGVFEKGDLKIRQETHVLLPEKFPRVAIFKTLYRNIGTTRIHIDSVYTQRILLGIKPAGTGEKQYDLASFQGGINEWGKNYSLIWLTPGFRQENFQGMHHTLPTEIVGGGMPFIDIWSKSMGIAMAHLEKQPEWLSLPVIVRPDGLCEAGIVEKPLEKLGMQEWLNPSDSFQTVLNAVIFHHLDFYYALNTYGDLLRARGINILKTSPDKAYEPYWKSWGFGMNFTLKMIFNVLPELKSIGITTANLDDGWFDYYGDWNVNRSAGKFPDGEKDMIAFVKKVHGQGFRTNLWWYPLGVSPGSRLAAERPDLLIQAEDGSFPLESRGLYQFCPAYQPALDYIRDLVTRFTDQWGYDGLYSDTRGLAAVPPCFNKAHHHRSPLESFRQIPHVYKIIDETLQKHSKEAFHEVCICATPHSPYNMPYYQIASASDPVNLLQVRRRIKVEKAIHGPAFCVGDCYQVPADEWDGFSCRQSFESAMGTGAQVTTFYKDLDPAQLKEWTKWVAKYREMKLGSAEYVNLYDIAFDKPEIHVIRKGNELYYGVYADSLKKAGSIELRGLENGLTYSVYDYGHDKELGTVKGNSPVINVDLKDYLLIRLVPVKN